MGASLFVPLATFSTLFSSFLVLFEGSFPSWNQYPAFCVETTAKSELKLVPYFSWCHRDVGEMQTWFPVE